MNLPVAWDGIFLATNMASGAGFHPADSNTAIAYLEEARAGGATYFLLPQTFIWWLDHYAGFKRYLEESYRLADSGEYGVLYELSSTEKNKLNQVSTRVDYLLGVLYPLLDKLRQNADAQPPVEDRTTQLAEAIQDRLAEIEQSLHQRTETNPDPSERLEFLAENLSGLAETIAELQKKLDVDANLNVTSVLDPKLKDQEEYLIAHFERRLVDQRREFDRHLQDQHVVMLRLLDEQQRLFQQNQREMDEKLSARIQEQTKAFVEAVEKNDRQCNEMNAMLAEKVVDLEAMIVEQSNQRSDELADIADQKILNAEARATRNAAAMVDAVKALVNSEATRISELKSQMVSLMEQVAKHQESKPKGVPLADTDDLTSHQRRFNLSIMQAMDSIAAHLRAVDAQMNLLAHRINIGKSSAAESQQEPHEGGV